MRVLVRNLAALLALAALGGCIFSSLEDDLERLDALAHLFAGTVTTDVPDALPFVVVALEDPDATTIESFRMLPDAGRFEIRTRREPTRFFAFADLNRDLVFQETEPHGWAGGGRAFDPDAEGTEEIQIVIRSGAIAGPPAPRALVGVSLDDHLNNYVRPAIGTVTRLNSPLFSSARAQQGLWLPFQFVEEGGAGIHFLEPYDPDRIPVLFVHGINATPRDFTAMIAALDTDRYQAWVLSYPTGLRLSWVARGMYQFLSVLHRQHRFRKLHVVAHSMGGLVSRGAINLCVLNHSCGYLRSYTTISTPWAGVDSARNGVRWAPTAVPVWHDLDPHSEYITTLFDTELPEGLPYHLIFGYRHDNLFSAESSDGVIKLTSQLRHEAQAAATSVRGFDEGHVSILDNPAVIAQVLADIDSASER
jgi:triacylglycerol esterase/lipase EstA (alpha/beta hydrolase family)